MDHEMTPRYTDLLRYPHGYTPAVANDIRRTFERARSQLRTREDPLDPSTWVEPQPEREPALDHDRN
jgi:hypothetical protein